VCAPQLSARPFFAVFAKLSLHFTVHTRGMHYRVTHLRGWAACRSGQGALNPFCFWPRCFPHGLHRLRMRYCLSAGLMLINGVHPSPSLCSQSPMCTDNCCFALRLLASPSSASRSWTAWRCCPSHRPQQSPRVSSIRTKTHRRYRIGEHVRTLGHEAHAVVDVVLQLLFLSLFPCTSAFLSCGGARQPHVHTAPATKPENEHPSLVTRIPPQTCHCSYLGALQADRDTGGVVDMGSLFVG